MRLKEIKPGMVIHCKNDEEKKALLEEAERLGYIWCSGELPTDCSVCSGNIINFHDKTNLYNFKHIGWSFKANGVTEFSDLILPELTAEEALRIKENICNMADCENCPLAYKNNGQNENCHKFVGNHPEKAVELLAKWKADHEKKEPEIETVDICRIIEIAPSGLKRCVYEEEMKLELPFGGDEKEKVAEILKHYCMEHEGEFIAVHEVVSRVKKGE